MIRDEVLSSIMLNYPTPKPAQLPNILSIHTPTGSHPSTPTLQAAQGQGQRQVRMGSHGAAVCVCSHVRSCLLMSTHVM